MFIVINIYIESDKSTHTAKVLFTRDKNRFYILGKWSVYSIYDNWSQPRMAERFLQNKALPMPALKCTVNREIFTMKKFSPVAYMAKIKQTKFLNGEQL